LVEGAKICSVADILDGTPKLAPFPVKKAFLIQTSLLVIDIPAALICAMVIVSAITAAGSGNP